MRLFNDTVKNNIAFGQNDTMPIELIEHAADISNSVEFVSKLDKQFDTTYFTKNKSRIMGIVNLGVDCYDTVLQQSMNRMQLCYLFSNYT